MSKNDLIMIRSMFKFNHSIKFFGERKNSRFQSVNAMNASVNIILFFLIVFSSVDDITCIFNNLRVHSIGAIKENTNKFFPKISATAFWFGRIFTVIRVWTDLSSLLWSKQDLCNDSNITIFCAL